MSKAIIIGITESSVIEYETFTQLKKAMGAEYAEVARRGLLGDIPVLILVDEEGKLNGKEVNDDASFMAEEINSYVLFADVLVGTAAMVKNGEEDLEGFSDDEVAAVRSALQQRGILFAS